MNEVEILQLEALFNITRYIVELKRCTGTDSYITENVISRLRTDYGLVVNDDDYKTVVKQVDALLTLINLGQWPIELNNYKVAMDGGALRAPAFATRRLELTPSDRLPDVERSVPPAEQVSVYTADLPGIVSTLVKVTRYGNTVLPNVEAFCNSLTPMQGGLLRDLYSNLDLLLSSQTVRDSAHYHLTTLCAALLGGKFHSHSIIALRLLMYVANYVGVPLYLGTSIANVGLSQIYQVWNEWMAFTGVAPGCEIMLRMIDGQPIRFEAVNAGRLAESGKCYRRQL